MITLTPRAAEELRHLLASRATSAADGLRLAVRKGGCAGYQYEMKVSAPEEGDFILDDQGTRVIVAHDSLDRLRGCEIDYEDSLSDAGFRIQNPNASRSCGCGTSFEPTDEPSDASAGADGESCA